MWWESYEGEEPTIFNDFYGWIKWTPFLNILDQYQSKQQIKGSSVNMLAKCWA
jgi:hypothetical protein